MSQDSVIIRCNHCGTKNRVPKGRIKEGPICGKCGAAVKPESIIVKCPECGTKNRVLKALMHDQGTCGKCHAPLKAIPLYDYVVETTDRTFSDEVLSFPGAVLLEFYSNSCGYCHLLTPILQQLAKEYIGRLKITKLNMDQNPMTASRYQVMSTPTMILFKEGREVDKLLGAMQKPEIESRLHPHL
jgi:thioredoxin 2